MIAKGIFQKNQTNMIIGSRTSGGGYIIVAVISCNAVAVVVGHVHQTSV